MHLTRNLVNQNARGIVVILWNSTKRAHRQSNTLYQKLRFITLICNWPMARHQALHVDTAKSTERRLPLQTQVLFMSDFHSRRLGVQAAVRLGPMRPCRAGQVSLQQVART